jgi:hypothetical protein
VSSNFWLYWAVTIPITAVIVAVWYIWEKRRAMRYEREDSDLQSGMEDLERYIMQTMRKRTMTKDQTWESRLERNDRLEKDDDNDYGAFRATQRRLTRLMTIPVASK